MAHVDASPSRERLDRVVEMLRGIEEEPGRRPGPWRTGRAVRRPRPLPRARADRAAQPDA